MTLQDLLFGLLWLLPAIVAFAIRYLKNGSFYELVSTKNDIEKIKELEEIEKMAGEEGFEPPYGGSKGRCLTTWLLPKHRKVYQIYYP